MINRVKKFFCMILVTACVAAMALPAFAAPKITQAEYEGKGRVEVEFGSKVQYKNAKVSVTDSKGKKYTAVIREKDDDDLTFTIKNYKEGVTYKYVISGIKKNSEKNYGQVTGRITIPSAAAAPKIQEIDYDRKDREVTFDFTGEVQWKSPKVRISDGKKNYVVKILEKDRDEITVRVKKLTRGNRYTYTITGVRAKGNKTWKTVKGTFIAK